MSKLTFHRILYHKFNTSTIILTGASFKLEDCEIDETKYGYGKAVVKLSPEKVIAMRQIQEKVNEHLQSEGLPHITPVYGNRVYPKIKMNSPKTTKLKMMWVNVEKKPFTQLWLEYRVK